MSAFDRRLTPLDRLLSVIDQGLRVSFAASEAVGGSGRATPQPAGPDTAVTLAPDAERQAAALMRVNHAGEVAAQALYHGQALVAREPEVRALLLAAAREEGDHLAWCAERLVALHSRPSRLNPLWFAASATIGALAGLAGDRVSLGFIVETERQVEGHLEEHLARLPAEDTASRAIIEQMKLDEAAHGARALKRGAAGLPTPIGRLMRLTARLMTVSAYRI